MADIETRTITPVFFERRDQENLFQYVDRCREVLPPALRIGLDVYVFSTCASQMLAHSFESGVTNQKWFNYVRNDHVDCKNEELLEDMPEQFRAFLRGYCHIPVGRRASIISFFGDIQGKLVYSYEKAKKDWKERIRAEAIDNVYGRRRYDLITKGLTFMGMLSRDVLGQTRSQFLIAENVNAPIHDEIQKIESYQKDPFMEFFDKIKRFRESISVVDSSPSTIAIDEFFQLSATFEVMLISVTGVDNMSKFRDQILSKEKSTDQEIVLERLLAEFIN